MSEFFILFLRLSEAIPDVSNHSLMATVSRSGGLKDWQETPRCWQKAPTGWEARTRNRGPTGGESGGVERHARGQLGSVLVRSEHQMRSVVSITADSDSSRRKWGQYPARMARRTGPPGVGHL